uniref:Uncharacterized protein n=1 Tax=viral metagenome TaxID=1070528 RepID=A0A6H1ZJ44_9ZZZZ
MAFTTTNILTAVKDDLGITNTAQDDKFLRYINRASSELDLIYSKAGLSWNESIEYYDIEIDVRDYTLDDPVYHVSKVFYKDVNKYYQLIYDPGILRDDYTPTSWESRNVNNFAIRGTGIIVLSGVPDKDKTDGLRVDCYKDTSAFVSGTSISKVKIFQEFYTVFVCRKYRQSQNKDSSYVNEFDAEFYRLRQEIVDLVGKRFRGPKQLRNYMG